MTIVYVNCEQCGNQFKRQSKETWKKSCVTCWIEGQRQKEQAHKQQAEQEQQERNQAHINSIKRMLETEQIIEQLAAENEALKNQVNRLLVLQHDMSQTIPPDKLKRLLMLCHPDKHNNSQTANDVTAWLLKQRV